VGCIDWVGGSGGRRYKDSFSVTVWLLCVFHLSLLSLSAHKSGFQAVLKVRPSSLFILFGCISISMASLMRCSEYPVFAESIKTRVQLRSGYFACSTHLCSP
jgi:hypothetical protein